MTQKKLATLEEIAERHEIDLKGVSGQRIRKAKKRLEDRDRALTCKEPFGSASEIDGEIVGILKHG